MASSSADRLDPASVELGLLLDELRLGYALIGGQAVNCWVRPRATEDVDFVVLADRDAIERVEARLRDLGYSYMRRMDGGESSGPDFVRMSLPGSTTIIDLQTAKTEFQDAVINRAAVVGADATRVATAEDLIVMKLIAGRSKDGDDARRLVQLDGLDLDYIRQRAGEWGLEERLEGLLRWLDNDRPGPPP